MTNPPTPSGDTTGTKTVKIVGLAVLGCVALCGVAGTCLFAALLLFGGLGQ